MPSITRVLRNQAVHMFAPAYCGAVAIKIPTVNALVTIKETSNALATIEAAPIATATVTANTRWDQPLPDPVALALLEEYDLPEVVLQTSMLN